MLCCARVLHWYETYEQATLNNLTAEIARKRRDVTRLQEDRGDMLDHLALIEARAKAPDEKRYSTAEVKRALGI